MAFGGDNILSSREASSATPSSSPIESCQIEETAETSFLSKPSCSAIRLKSLESKIGITACREASQSSDQPLPDGFNRHSRKRRLRANRQLRMPAHGASSAGASLNGNVATYFSYILAVAIFKGSLPSRRMAGGCILADIRMRQHSSPAK